MKISEFSRFIVPFVSLIFLASLSSCATLSESECKSANWEIIGLEDGSQGRKTSYIGEHRQACSDYNIAPNLEAYRRGHSAGLKQFCTESNGYSQGIKGQGNNHVCPSNLSRQFNRGFKEGYAIYLMKSEIQSLRNSIASHEYRLHEINDYKVGLEDELVKNSTSEQRRRDLLAEIKELERESENLYHELDDMKLRLIRLEDRFNRKYSN